jgi:hypothetical protein
MTEKAWRLATGFAVLLAAYFVGVGAQLRGGRATPAQDAVGLGLIVLGGGFAITAFLCLCAWLSAREERVVADREAAEQPPAP